jgi:hypothetical protein
LGLQLCSSLEQQWLLQWLGLDLGGLPLRACMHVFAHHFQHIHVAAISASALAAYHTCLSLLLLLLLFLA